MLKLVVDKKVLGLHNEVINHKRGLIVFARMLEVLDDYLYSSDEWRLLLENVDGPA